MLGFVEDSAEVFADDAEGDELDTSEEEEGDHDGWIARYGFTVDDGLDDDVDEVEEGEAADEETEDGADAQGSDGVAGESVEGEFC